MSKPAIDPDMDDMGMDWPLSSAGGSSSTVQSTIPSDMDLLTMYGQDPEGTRALLFGDGQRYVTSQEMGDSLAQQYPKTMAVIEADNDEAVRSRQQEGDDRLNAMVKQWQETPPSVKPVGHAQTQYPSVADMMQRSPPTSVKQPNPALALQMAKAQALKQGQSL